MASRTARCIALLLCVAAVPSGAAAQDTSRNVVETIPDGVKSVISKESVPLLSTAAASSLVTVRSKRSAVGSDMMQAQGGMAISGSIRQ